jgi:glutathione S-transferase
MSLTLYFHPLSSFCHKVLIAFYENAVPFETKLLELGAEAEAEFLALWPIGKMPVLRDEKAGRTIPESTIIIEYLARHYPGPVELVPSDPDLALKVRLADRIFDNYLQLPMQKIVTDRLRPEGEGDPHGVAYAKERLKTAYGVVDKDLEGKIWATGDRFTMADCAAAPALFYAQKVVPFDPQHRNLQPYLDRLMKRDSFARVLKEAQPYFDMFPG